MKRLVLFMTVVLLLWCGVAQSATSTTSVDFQLSSNQAMRTVDQMYEYTLATVASGSSVTFSLTMPYANGKILGARVTTGSSTDCDFRLTGTEAAGDDSIQVYAHWTDVNGSYTPPTSGFPIWYANRDTTEAVTLYLTVTNNGVADTGGSTVYLICEEK